MWDVIDSIMHPNELVPDKSILKYDDVFTIYSKIINLDQVFREILQISVLKREIQKEKNNSIIE
jgi:hypothetical protein